MTEKNENEFHLVLEGQLTVRTADAVFETLRSAVGSHALVSVDATTADDIDLSFIQLLLAARKSACAAERRLVLRRPPDGALISMLQRAGLPVDVLPDAGGFWFAEALP